MSLRIFSPSATSPDTPRCAAMPCQATPARPSVLACLALGATALLPALWAEPGHAQSATAGNASTLDTIQVTATRFGDPVQQVPNSVVVITSEDLAARGVHDLRGALANVAGVTVGPGGDDGVASASLGLLGRRETDDFLLVIDGIPAGGAFTPQFAALNLHGVERIEIIRGTAPVYFGTTAFAGTVSVIHYPAGRGGSNASLSVGTRGSFDVGVHHVLSSGPLRQSVTLDATRQGVDDPRAGFRRVHGAYRAATSLGAGQARVDLDLTALHDRPASPTPVSPTGIGLLPASFNQNPSDGRIDTSRVMISAGYDLPLGFAQWSSVVSLTSTRTDTVRGFLNANAIDAVGDNAAGYAQGRRIEDLFADTHLTQELARGVEITYGVNLLLGRLRIENRQFDYLVPFDGSQAPDSGSLSTTDNTRLRDRRSLFGTYAQMRWKPSTDVTVLGGLRWNHIDESRDAYGDAEGSDHQAARRSRFTGSLGVNWRAWRDADGDLDDLSLYLNLGNTFQPPQVDFGPDAQIGPILPPEALRSVEVGAKLDGLDGRFDLALSAFFVGIANRPQSITLNGQPAVVAGGQERFRGLLADAHLQLTAGAKLSFQYSSNKATYGNFLTQLDGPASATQLSGKRIALVPDQVLGLGAVLGSSLGWHGSVTVRRIGRRFLDPQNQIAVAGFVSADLLAGYRWHDTDISLAIDNIGDRRDLVVASELGPSQVYRTSGRRITLTLNRRFD